MSYFLFLLTLFIGQQEAEKSTSVKIIQDFIDKTLSIDIYSDVRKQDKQYQTNKHLSFLYNK